MQAMYLYGDIKSDLALFTLVSNAAGLHMIWIQVKESTMM
jgi:hypothetical protein